MRSTLVLSAVGEGLAAVSSRIVTQNGSRFSAKRREEEVSSEAAATRTLFLESPLGLES